jgi:hypothetical protein
MYSVCSTCNQVQRMSTSMLSQDVIKTFAEDGCCLLQAMLHRHAGYKNLPCPLRWTTLASKATEGFVQRTMIVRVDARTLREELNMAE